jgi:hypothetical protein
LLPSTAYQRTHLQIPDVFHPIETEREGGQVVAVNRTLMLTPQIDTFHTIETEREERESASIHKHVSQRALVSTSTFLKLLRL